MAPYARHGVNVNVDFYSGVVYHLLGIERDLFVPIFAIGRVPGWAVQVLEQLRTISCCVPSLYITGLTHALMCRSGNADELTTRYMAFPNCGRRLDLSLRVESLLLSY